MKVCVFASSSSRINNEYNIAASKLGEILAQSNIEVVYGGGGIGLMGILADAVIKNGGKVTGVIPSFMQDEGWGHDGIEDMIITPDMGERKKKMFGLSDGVIALPGGIGTLEELAEAITLKQLSLFDGPIIILNTLGFYDHLIDFLDNMVDNHFLRTEHKSIWQVVITPEEAVIALKNREKGSEEWRKIAKI
jgi:uncharacterized protein (TIGR00730 family)